MALVKFVALCYVFDFVLFWRCMRQRLSHVCSLKHFLDKMNIFRKGTSLFEVSRQLVCSLQAHNVLADHSASLFLIHAIGNKTWCSFLVVLVSAISLISLKKLGPLFMFFDIVNANLTKRVRVVPSLDLSIANSYSVSYHKIEGNRHPFALDLNLGLFLLSATAWVSLHSL